MMKKANFYHFLKRIPIVLIVILFLCGADNADKNHVSRVYPLYILDASDIVKVVKIVLGNNGQVIYDRTKNTLTVITTPKRHKILAPLIEELNVPPKNVRIDVMIRQEGSQDTRSIVATGSGKVVIEPGIRDYRTKTSDNVKQMILVQSGSEAALRVGYDIPFIKWIIDYGREQGYIESEIEMVKVGASLRVRPRIIGNGPLIAIRITPELSGLVDKQTMRIKYTKLSTELMARDGQSINLGGLGKNSEFYNKFLIGVDKQGNRQRIEITLTPHIMDSPTIKARP